MPQQELTTKEAAAQLDVPLGTFKHWVDHLPVPARQDSQGRRKFDEQALAVLERIKQLRNIDDRGLDSIRIILQEELGEAGPADGRPTAGPVPAVGQPTVSEPSAHPQPAAGDEPAARQPNVSREPADDDRPAVVQLMAGPELDEAALAERVASAVGQAVAEAVARETELAEKYARAAHQIGKLEERVATLEAERQRLVEQVSQPSAGPHLDAMAQALAALQDARAREDSQRIRLLAEQGRLQVELKETRQREQAERDRIAHERDHLAAELAHAREQLANLPGKLERPWWKIWG